MAERTENKGSTEFQHEDVDNEMQNKTAHVGMTVHSRRSFIAASALLGASIAFGAQRKDNNINGLTINNNKTMKMTKCKITVLKRHFDEELATEYGVKGIGKCPLLKEGQVFYADWSRPEGFCDEAWKAIYQYVFALAHGCGNFYYNDWIEKPGIAICSCNDGLRPVIFKIEKTDEESVPDNKE
jgi:uncharacterized repeat protein (TIGR04076 family)